MTTIIAHPFANGLPFNHNVRTAASRSTRRATMPKPLVSASARLCTQLERADASGTRLDAMVYGSLVLAGIAWPAYECIRAILAY